MSCGEDGQHGGQGAEAGLARVGRVSCNKDTPSQKNLHFGSSPSRSDSIRFHVIQSVRFSVSLDHVQRYELPAFTSGVRLALVAPWPCSRGVFGQVFFFFISPRASAATTQNRAQISAAKHTRTAYGWTCLLPESSQGRNYARTHIVQVKCNCTTEGVCNLREILFVAIHEFPNTPTPARSSIMRCQCELRWGCLPHLLGTCFS